VPLGDILVIKETHRKAAGEITDLVLREYQGNKVSLAIGAESGAGKSEIAHVVAQNLFQSERKLRSFVVHTDDFFLLPHKERNELRKQTNLASIGPSEIDFDITSSAYKLLADFKDVQVLICEGLYAPMLDVTYKIFMDLTYHDTKEFRLERGKEVINEFRLKVLEREHQAVSQLREQVDYVITKDYSLEKR
jgi:uridine kinase